MLTEFFLHNLKILFSACLAGAFSYSDLEFSLVKILSNRGQNGHQRNNYRIVCSRKHCIYARNGITNELGLWICMRSPCIQHEIWQSTLKYQRADLYYYFLWQLSSLYTHHGKHSTTQITNRYPSANGLLFIFTGYGHATT